MDTSRYKRVFLEEAYERLSGIEKGLLSLEERPDDPSVVDGLFRHYHSIKGMSSSMGYEHMKILAHAQEDLLERIRSKKEKVTPELLSLLLECLDVMKGLAEDIKEDRPIETDIKGYVERLRGFKSSTTVKKVSQAPVPQALRLPHVIKVESNVFDDLLTLVGDLFMAFSSLKTITDPFRSIELRDNIHNLGKTINAFYHSILSARMLPFEDLVQGLPRIVRDISRSRAKEVNLSIEGADITLDRTILSQMGNPLIHIIKNAVDHGIESPEERTKQGKPRTGQVMIRLYTREDRVVIEVEDDGRGIDCKRVIEKAISMGFPVQKVMAMSEKEALSLIFTPGLSLSKDVTYTSGRGVGMDAVKETIEGLGGSISVESTPGRGTKFVIDLPRTTSIIKVLLVHVCEEMFLVPVSRIEKVMELKREDIRNDTIRYRKRDVPVLSLAEALGMPGCGDRGDTIALIVEDGKRGHVAILVDDFGEEMNAYIKPPPPPINRLNSTSGIAIMGDGRPVFLLDIPEIVSKAYTTQEG